MSVYEKLTFKDGQVLTAEHLNHMEGGIAALDEAMQNLGGADSGAELPEVTVDDNGKVLQVVDGAWTAAMPDVSDESGTSCACFEEIMAETKLLFDVTIETELQTYVESPLSNIPALILGKAYILTIDGHSFEAVAEADTYNGIDIIRIGNHSAAMPFMFGVATDGSLGACQVYGRYIRGEYASGSIEDDNIKRYLTLSLRATKLTGLPEITTADNDKVVQVVNGVWATVTIADSAIGKYIDEYIGAALEGEY